MKKDQKLSLEAFKTKNIDSKDSKELEKLTGAILGSCHPNPYSDAFERWKIGVTLPGKGF